MPFKYAENLKVGDQIVLGIYNQKMTVVAVVLEEITRIDKMKKKMFLVTLSGDDATVVQRTYPGFHCVKMV